MATGWQTVSARGFSPTQLHATILRTSRVTTVQIKKSAQICGFPAIQIRDLMRRWQSPSDGECLIRDTLGVTSDEAKDLLKALLAAGLVELDPDQTFGPEVRIERTLDGSALAMASAAPPVHRAVVQQRLHELIARMQIVTEDPRFLVGIEEASVFGSYLASVDRLGDLDVSYKVFRKITDQRAYSEASDRAAKASGRRFQTIVDLLFWPHSEVRLFLKNRSRVYSLSENERLLEDPTVARLIIFKDRKPVSNWKDL